MGVGVFGLPFVFAQAGFATGLAMLAVVGSAVIALNLMYGDLVLQTPGRHRIGGYVREYLGDGWGRLASASMVAAIAGAMLAFMIVGGDFLHALFSPLLGGGREPYAFAMAAAVAFASSKGLRIASRIEAAVVAVLLFLFLYVSLAALPHAQPARLLAADPSLALAVYGPVLFSLSGAGIIAEMRDVLGAPRLRLLPKAILWGVVIVLALYVAFTASVVAATGGATTPIAFDGLVPLLGPSFLAVSATLGTLAVFSIYLMNAVQLQNLLVVDLRVGRRLAWAAASIVAPVLYLTGARDFIDVIGFFGAVFGGLIGLSILAAYEAMRRTTWCREHVCLDVPRILSAAVGAMLVLGVLIELIRL